MSHPHREEDCIYDANDSFDLNQLKLTAPAILSGGHHFMKYIINDHPLYLQSGKCTTKQGIIKAGKRMYCDLVFTNEHESLIRWLENLEVFSQKYIYDHRSQWFETDLEMHDIENSFTSPLKLYKSGKYYLLRVNIPMRLGKCTLRVFDEDETVVDLDTIRDTTQMYTILELQGIRCSARSFQIEIEMKQMMVLRPNNMFDTCVISKGGVRIPASTIDVVSKQEPVEEPVEAPVEEPVEEPFEEPFEEPVEAPAEAPVEEPVEAPIEAPIEEPVEELPLEEVEEEVVAEVGLIDMDTEMKYDDKDPPMRIRSRNDVYYEMYLAAKTKAQTARDLAIQSFLEAKRIQNLYQIEDNDSDLVKEFGPNHT